MFDVKVLLEAWFTLGSVRGVARSTGFDRKTVARYVRAADACGLSRFVPIGDDEVGRVVRKVRSRTSAAPSAPWARLSEQRAALESLIDRRPPLALRRIHALLAEEGTRVSYPTLRRFAMRELGWRGRRAASALLPSGGFASSPGPARTDAEQGGGA